MIKINLLNTRVSGETEVGYDQNMDAGTFGNYEGDNRTNAMKMAIIFVPVLILIAWEFYNVGQLEDQNAIIKAKVNATQTEIKSLEAKAKKSLEAQEKVKELENKIDILRNITNKRMREIKALDYFQSIIPDKVWFGDIKYNKNRFDLKGFAATDEELTAFLQSLESKNYFSDVILRKATEVKSKDGVVKNFEISCNLEGGD